MTRILRISNATGLPVSNPGFEHFDFGHFDDWSIRNAPVLSRSESNVYAGRYSAQIQNTGAQADRGIYQDVAATEAATLSPLPPLLAGHTYRVSVTVYVAVADAVLAVSNGGGFGSEVRASSVGTGWQRLEVKKAAAATGLRIALYANAAGANVFFDDVRIASAAVDFMDGGADNIFHLREWRPAVTEYKAGGVFSDSSLADGRRLVLKKFANAVESVEFQVEGAASEDATMEALIDLFLLMEQAADYWTTRWQNTPVYIEAKGANETHSRYAILHTARAPELPDPFSIEWQQLVLMPLNLIAERGDWLGLPPGAAVYAALTVQGPSARYGLTDAPTASADDCSVDTVGEVIALANASIELGQGTVGNGGGFRFRTVNVPPGATIVNAFIRFEAAGASIGYSELLITGEDSDSAAAFSTYANYAARPRTDAYEGWRPDDFTTGNSYDTPDIAKIVQEIVGRSGWASGNDLTVFVEENDSKQGVFRLVASFDHATQAEPQLHITYTIPVGQDSFVANKRNEASITHLINFDASAATGTEHPVPVTLPFTLFPSSPAVNDYVAFAVDTAGATAANSGPFASLIFNLSVAAAASGSYTIVWEYYNGSAWVSLAVQDNTEQLSQLGVSGVFWSHPSDWATVQPKDTTGYMVRARLSALSGTFTRPVQQIQDVYTVTWPYMEVAAGAVGGDLPALTLLRVLNESDGIAFNAPFLWANRVIVGMRSVHRGERFTAFINLADEQNPPGVTVSIVNPVSGTPSFINLLTTATGRAFDWSPTTGPLTLANKGKVSIDATLANQFIGSFHAYIRGRQVSGSAGDLGVQLRLRGPMGNDFLWTSEEVFFENTEEGQILDFGQVDIFPTVLSPFETAYQCDFPIYLANYASAARQLRLYDLILIPVDEWSGDFKDVDNSVQSVLGRPSSDISRFLDIDSATFPKRDLRAVIKNADDERIVYNFYQVSAAGPVVAQVGHRLRYWFLTERFGTVGVSTVLTSQPEVAHLVSLYVAQRYRGGRGSR